ncbi:hypothetical protein F5B20DRAFT_578876 [Whalleya microplaca]|nr:hypothetical protein F5B20DRAFT_578876 [Whalleya microplaca]
MAQQGCTYRRPTSMDPLLPLTFRFIRLTTSSIEVSCPVRSISQTQSRGNDENDEQNSVIQERGDDTRSSPIVRNQYSQSDGQRNDQEWTVVPHPEANVEENAPSSGISSHFDITLGWGKWKTTIFSWDLNIRKQAGEPPQRNIQERK